MPFVPSFGVPASAGGTVIPPKRVACSQAIVLSYTPPAEAGTPCLSADPPRIAERQSGVALRLPPHQKLARLPDGGGHPLRGAGGVLAQGEGPEAIAMTIRRIAGETQVAGKGRFALDASEIIGQAVIGTNANRAVLEGPSQVVRQRFLDLGGEVNRLDLPAEPLRG